MVASKRLGDQVGGRGDCLRPILHGLREGPDPYRQVLAWRLLPPGTRLGRQALAVDDEAVLHVALEQGQEGIQIMRRGDRVQDEVETLTLWPGPTFQCRSGE